MTRFTALALAQGFAVLAAQTRYRVGFHHGFGRPELNLHNTAGRFGFSYGSRSAHTRATSLLKQHDNYCGDGQTCALIPLVKDVDGLLHELSITEAARPPDFWQTNLRHQVSTYIASLPLPENGRSPVIAHTIPIQIEYLNPLLKMALYRVITEGISNAMLYADAQKIDVLIERKPYSINIYIENDGRPLPDDSFKHKSAYGIYYLLEEFRRELGAEGDLVALPSGARLTLIIPALPDYSPSGPGADPPIRQSSVEPPGTFTQ